MSRAVRAALAAWAVMASVMLALPPRSLADFGPAQGGGSGGGGSIDGTAGQWEVETDGDLTSIAGSGVIRTLAVRGVSGSTLLIEGADGGSGVQGRGVTAQAGDGHAINDSGAAFVMNPGSAAGAGGTATLVGGASTSGLAGGSVQLTGGDGNDGATSGGSLTVHGGGAAGDDRVVEINGSLTISTPLAAAQGGTGQSTAANAVQAFLDAISTTQGTILYHNGTDWVALSPGTAGHVLSTNGAAANPSWVAPSALPASVTTISAQRQASGASLTYTVPGGTLSAVGDELELATSINTGTSGNATLTITLGGTTLGTQATLAAGNSLDVRMRIVYVDATTVTVVWTWWATSAVQDTFNTLTVTVPDLTSDRDLVVTMSGGTSPDAETMRVVGYQAP